MSKTAKRIFSVLLATVLIFGATPLTGFVGLELPEISAVFEIKATATDTAYTEGYYTYTVDEKGNATITGCDKSITGYIVIPSNLNGHPVTSIGDDAFFDCEGLTGITIPDGVSSIGSSFGNCYSLVNIIIPDSVTSIGYYAFGHCESLTSIIIPDSVISIDDRAFYSCTSLTSITIPDSVTSIGVGAFAECISLTDLIVNKANKYFFSDEHGVLFNKDKTKLIQYPAGNSRTSYTIPDSVTSIGDGAFYYCYSLTSVTIPDSVTSIDSAAFYGCTSLESITIPDGVASVEDALFHNCESLVSVTIPDSVTSIGGLAFRFCTSLTSITIPDSVTSIGAYAFEYCESLTNITIPDGVTSIDYAAFSNCKSLASITIPDGVTSIGDFAFYNCLSLTSITIPDGVTSIGDTAFYNCLSLTSVTIPDGVTSIGYYTFQYCYNLSDVIIPDGTTSIGESAFFGSMAMEYIHIPSSITEIGYMVIMPDFEKAEIVQNINYALENATEEELAEFASQGITKETVANWKETTVICSDTEDCYAKEYAEENGYTFVVCDGHGAGAHTHSHTSSVTTQPTCTKAGIITYTCNCGDSYTEDIAVIAHTDGEWETVIEATCTAQGKRVKKCTACGTVTANEIIPVITHSDNNSDGFCDSCDRITDEDLINGIYIAISPVEKHTIKYMESATLTVTTANLPEGYTVKWVAEGKGVTIKAYGNNCKVTSTSTGSVIIKAYVVDTKGRVVIDENSKPICDSEYFHSDANFWLKIIYFFKMLFKFY